MKEFMKSDKMKKSAVILLIVSLVCMLLCGIVVNAVQTQGGKVSMKDLNIETDSGYTMSAYLFIPDTATAETPAPAIVVSHGLYNNKEMTDANYVELARRGYVVLAIDQPDHGNSEVTNAASWDGIYQGALALSRMPFVDTDKIGVTGHSMGAFSCTNAVRADNAAETQIISAVLLNSCDPNVSDGEGNYVNIYGSRDVGVIAGEYDDFFFMYTDEDGVTYESPYWMESDNAQAFLYFGEDPTGLEAREAYTYYTETIDGEEAIRVIYRPNINHPWCHFSKKAETNVIDFFEEAFGAPNPIVSSNQIWQWKEAFNAIGLIGFVLFICGFGGMLLYTRTFESLREKELVQPAAVMKGKVGALWFWLSLAAGFIFGTAIYLPIMWKGNNLHVSQGMAMGLGLWSTLCGCFSIVCMLLFYFTFGKRNGMDPVAVGIKVPIKKFGLGLLMSFIVIIVAYGCVFVESYFFNADFRIWTVGIKAFDSSLLKNLPYVLLFFTYYIAISVATNCFNFNKIGKRFNALILALIAAAPAVFLSLYQNIYYFTQKEMRFQINSYPMYIISLYQVMSILFVTLLVNRFLYRRTKNPYIAGVINAVIVGVFTITNTCTYLL